MGHAPNEIAKGSPKRRGTVPKVSDRNAAFNVPQGINFTQSANVKGTMAKGKPVRALTKVSTKKKPVMRGAEPNAARTAVAKSDKGRNTRVEERAQVKAVRGVTKLAKGSSASVKASKSDKGKSKPTTQKSAIQTNMQSKKNAVYGLSDISGLGSGGKRGRYQFVKRPTDRK